jgi:Mg-chelatase subunit ChlI
VQPEQLIDRLKEHPNIRTKTRIAEICGVPRQSLRFWTRVPSEYCRKLEKACDAAVTRYEMRPDVFGPGPNDDSDLGAA